MTDIKIVKQVCNLQNIYDGVIGGLHYMPVRSLMEQSTSTA
jgi:hypothetical protein